MNDTRPDSSQTPTWAPSEQEVAVRAYELWLDRGCPPGDGHEDWIRAKLQLTSECSLRRAFKH